MGVDVGPHGLQRLPGDVPQRGPGVQATVRPRLSCGGESCERDPRGGKVDQQRRGHGVAREREIGRERDGGWGKTGSIGCSFLTIQAPQAVLLGGTWSRPPHLVFFFSDAFPSSSCLAVCSTQTAATFFVVHRHVARPAARMSAVPVQPPSSGNFLGPFLARVRLRRRCRWREPGAVHEPVRIPGDDPRLSTPAGARRRRRRRLQL